MKIKSLIMLIFALGLIGFIFSAEVAEQKSGGDPDLSKRISDLEKQVKALQDKVKGLESRSYRGLLTSPTQPLSGKDQMPPGAREFEFNGQKVWWVPVNQEPKP
jgi:hypothetical protein